MMTPTLQWKSRRRSKRIYSTKRTGLTVSTVMISILRTNNVDQFTYKLIFYVLIFSTFCLGEIALLEGLTVVYKSNIDLFFYVIGSSHENEVNGVIFRVLQRTIVKWTLKHKCLKMSRISWENSLSHLYGVCCSPF